MKSGTSKTGRTVTVDSLLTTVAVILQAPAAARTHAVRPMSGMEHTQPILQKGELL